MVVLNDTAVSRSSTLSLSAIDTVAPRLHAPCILPPMCHSHQCYCSTATASHVQSSASCTATPPPPPPLPLAPCLSPTPTLHAPPCQLANTIQALACKALASIVLTAHTAQHPRLGVLDHVSVHPLGSEASLPLAAQAATAIGQQLSQAPLQLPVYYYGAAHPEKRRLADIRRSLGGS